jgi:hypothetical protein
VIISGFGGLKFRGVIFDGFQPASHIFHKGPVAVNEMANVIFGYFSTTLGTSVDGHEKKSPKK